MLSQPTFFTYSPAPSQEGAERYHVLFHLNRSGWLVVNNTGLQIATILQNTTHAKDAINCLIDKYSLSPEIARKDVSYVADQLRTLDFLDENNPAILTRSPSLDSLYIHLTSRCNLNCPHCYVSKPNNKTDKDLSISSLFKMIDQLADRGGKSIFFGGGEPLLHPEIKKILKHASTKLEIHLLTNGTLIDKEWASFLGGLDAFVQISIDGSKPEIHDSIRGEGNFEKSLKAVQYLQEKGAGEKINFATTIMGQNLRDLSRIIALGAQRGVPLVRFLPLRQTGRAREEWEHIGAAMSVEDYERFYDYTSDLNACGRTSAKISCGLSGFLLKIPIVSPEDDLWCPVGKQMVVDINGDAFPCVYLMREEFKLGNVNDESLSFMVQSDKMKMVCRALSERRQKIQKCAVCTWRNLCQAGCMGQALDNTGTIWDTDDFCDYRKRAYKEAFDKILAIDD